MMFHRLRRSLAMRAKDFHELDCPNCASKNKTVFLKVDRYLLPVNFSICDDCGLVYTSRNLYGEGVEDFYRNEYRNFYEGISEVNSHYVYSSGDRLKAGFRMLRIQEVIPEFKKVLEIGSGLGYFLDECRSKGIRDLMGIELGQVFRDFTQKHLGFKNEASGTALESLNTLPFKPDLVVMIHVLEHMVDPCWCLQWIRRHIDEKGWLVLEVPDIDGDWQPLGLMNFHIAHRVYFSAITLSNMLAKNGYIPWFITRDNTEGIYHGNLRIFAKPGNAGPIYPIKMQKDNTLEIVKKNLKLLSFQNGIPRAIVRLR